MPAAASLGDALSAVFAGSGVDPRAWALGFARATPAVALVPAFGLGAVPVPTRLLLGLSLGLCVAPALSAAPAPAEPLLLALARSAFSGLPVAILASLAMYVAGMAGALVDDLRQTRETVALPNLPEAVPPVSALFTLLASIAFLHSGGAARVVAALAEPALDGRWSWAHVARSLASSVELALAIGAPLVVTSVVLEIAGALIARSATPAFIAPLLSPLKSLALLGVLALVLERVAELIALLSRSAF